MKHIKKIINFNNWDKPLETIWINIPYNYTLEIGDEVVINDKSQFKDQGYKYNKKMIGIVTEHKYNKYKYTVVWEDKSDYFYNNEDLLMKK